MTREEKLMKDRKILRKIDFNLALQSQFLVAANILIFLFITLAGGFYSHHDRLVLVIGGLLLVSSAAGFYYCIRFDALYGAGPARWRSVFTFLQLSSALLMGTFAASVILLEELSVNGFLVSLYLVGYCAMNNMEWSPYHRRNLGRLSLCLFPAIAAFTVIIDLNGITVAAGLFLIWFMLARQSRLMNGRHWDSVRTHHELHTKARDLAHAVKEANNASQIKTEFLASITHEIRTPMNNVLGMLALLDDTDLSPQQQELQKVAVHSGEALLGLMDDILDFSRISSGQVQLEEVVFNLKRCIDQTLELMGPRAHDKGLELSCVYDGDLPVRVKGDPERLAQLINNLVTNAIKYSAGTDILLAVQMQRLSEAEGELKVTVTDNGKGIDPVLQDRLFEAFSKNSAQNNYAEAGTGLGLAISKGLAECMQGEIGFSSAPEQGASFWFTARLKLSTQQAQKPAELRELMQSHILLVDIEGGLRAALMAELAGWQMEVRFASSQFNPVETLLAAQRAGTPYHLVFINLPIKQKTSLELCQDIRQHAELRNSHLIVLASLAQRADASRMKADIAQDVEWLSKPITREKLVRALTQSFNLQEAEGEGLEKVDSALLSGSEGRRVLLVEDNAVNQMVARGMLTRLGYLVTSVANGKEALGLLEDKTFDLILMDCLMPVLDGYETTRIWREKEKQKGGHLPIVAMTASVVEGEQQRCLSTGMDDYLSKPVNIDELNAKLRQWLGADKAAAPELDEGITPRDPQRRTA